MAKNIQKSKKTKNKKSRARTTKIILITAIIFFLLGVCFTYAIKSFYKRNNNTNNNTETDTDNEIVVSGGTENEKEKTGQTTVSNNNGTGKSEEENLTTSSQDPNFNPPTNPTVPNVEKLNVEALEKLDNTKLSWWIKLNDENKPSTIPDDIRNLIKKYDGVFQGDTTQKAVYLTFDEGYENGYTAAILDTLKENNVKAIFFVTGSYIENSADLVQRMLDEGHQVGNHTINHPSLPDAGYEELENELLGLEKKFYEKFNVGFKYMRPPMGEYSERTLAAAQQLGYKTVFWSFAYDDWYTDKIRGADYAYNIVMKNLHNGAVFLLHAVSKDNAEALDRIIKGIREKGYEIKPFDL